MFEAEGHLLNDLAMYAVDVPEGADDALAMPVSPRVINPRGGVIGGLLSTLIDIVAGRAAIRAVSDSTKTLPTIDLHIRYLSPVVEGPAVAVATVVRAGRSTVVVQVEVRDQGRDVLAAIATASFAVLTARPGQEFAGSVLH